MQTTCKDTTAIGLMFSAEMVRAIIAGHKTQTRRVVDAVDGHEKKAKFAAGGLIWVREAWKLFVYEMGPPLFSVLYLADNCMRNGLRSRDQDQNRRMLRQCYDDPIDNSESARVRSPMYMPRWASRITLRITSVDQTYLHGITEQDAIAEGFGGTAEHPTVAFAQYWDRLHLRRDRWGDNPMVRAVSFVVEEVKR